MTRTMSIFLCLCALFWPAGLAAADTSAETLSLKEAIALAYQQNPRVTRARKAVDGAKGDYRTAQAWPNPEIEMEIGGLKKGEDGRRKAHLDAMSIKQPFDPIGVRSLNRTIGHNGILIEELSVKEVWAEVYVAVRSTYTQLILNSKELELQRENLRSMRQFYSDVQVRFQSGQALKNHVQRAKIELLKAESQYLSAENQIDVGKARLNLLLGRDRDVFFETENTLEEERLAFALTELIDLALTNRPDLKIQETLLDTRKNMVLRQQLSRLPSFALGFQAIDEEYEEDYAVVLEFSMPLWDGNQGAVKKSKAERAAQEILLKAQQEEIAFEVYAAYKDARLAEKQLRLYKQSLAEANDMLRLAGLRYGEGHIDFLNYLDQILASLDTRMQYYHGLHRLSQSINDLEKAVYSSLREETFLQ